MLSVVCWKWKSPPLYPQKYTAAHVNTLYNMVKRNYSNAFRFICFTDDPTGIAPGIECLPAPADFAGLESPLGVHFPACYRRLAGFDASFRDLVGERYVTVDLDCVIVDRLEPLWDRPDDFVVVESPIAGQPYNGSMWLHRCGTRRQVLREFHPLQSPALTKTLGFTGSDQAWLAHALPNEAVWTDDDGVVQWQYHCRNRGWIFPRGSRIIFFAGGEKPWDGSALNKAPWIKAYYK